MIKNVYKPALTAAFLFAAVGVILSLAVVFKRSFSIVSDYVAAAAVSDRIGLAAVNRK